MRIHTRTLVHCTHYKPSKCRSLCSRTQVSLPEKFDGTRAQLRGFINQFSLIIRLQPRRYSDDFRQVGLIGTLLTGQAQAWFAPLVETSSPLLNDFHAFLTEFEATFGETNRRRAALNKLYSLQQGSRSTSPTHMNSANSLVTSNGTSKLFVAYSVRGFKVILNISS